MGGYLELPPFFLFSLGDGMTIQFPFGKEVTMCFHQCNRKQLWGIGGVHVHIFAALIHILRWSSTSCTEVPAETSYPPQFAAPDIGLVIEFVVWWRRYFPQCLNESIFSGAIVNTENIPKHMGKKASKLAVIFSFKNRRIGTFFASGDYTNFRLEQPRQIHFEIDKFCLSWLDTYAEKRRHVLVPKISTWIGSPPRERKSFLVGSFPHIPLWNRVLRAFPYFFGCLRTLPNFPNITW